MTKTTPEQNKALVLKAFDTLFNRRDYEAAAGFWTSTSSTALISNQVVTACSILSAAHPTICITNTSSSWRRATTSLFTADSQAMAVPLHG